MLQNMTPARSCQYERVVWAIPYVREALPHSPRNEVDVLVTLANPLPAAIVGNPFRGRHMSKHRRMSPAARRRSARTSALRYRWKKRTRPGGNYAGFKAVVHDKAGKRKKHKSPRGHRWAWTGRKGTVSLFRKGLLVATNPVKAISNLGGMIIDPVKDLPKSLPALFKGSPVQHLLVAGAGGVTGLVGGQILQGLVFNGIAKIAPNLIPAAMSKGIVQRVVGASFALITGGVIANFALKGDNKKSFMTGTAAAALIEAIFPGRIAGLLQGVPVVGAMIAPQASPVQGLAGLFGSDELAGIGAYVDASAYQGVNGVGAYVDASAYQGVNGYVESKGYQGVNGPMDDAVAGMGAGIGYDPNQLAGAGHLGDLGAMGSNMASHLDS